MQLSRCGTILCKTGFALPRYTGTIQLTKSYTSLSGIHHGLRKSDRLSPQRSASKARGSDRTRPRLSTSWTRDSDNARPQRSTPRIRKAPGSDEPRSASPWRKRVETGRLENFAEREDSSRRLSSSRRRERAPGSSERGSQRFGDGKGRYSGEPGALQRQLRDLGGMADRPKLGIPERFANGGLDSRDQGRSGSRDRGGRPARGVRDTPYQRYDKDAEVDKARRFAGSLRDRRRSGSAVSREADEDVETTRRSTKSSENMEKGEDNNAHPIRIHYTTAASQFLYGKSEVEAALRASRRKLYRLYVYGGPNRQDVERDFALEQLAEKKGVEKIVLHAHQLPRMDKMSGGRPHNGFVLEASPLPQIPLDGLGRVSDGTAGFPITRGHQTTQEAEINGEPDFIKTNSKTHKPLVVIPVQIVDPGNLGAILRSASFLGASAVAMTKHSSATLTPVALKASSGAAESLNLFTIQSLPDFLKASQEEGWKVYAAAPATGKAKQRRNFDMLEIEEMDPLRKDPCILLVGNEGEGLSRQIKSKADYEVSIANLSQSMLVDSLNVSVATALLCSAFLKGQAKEANATPFGDLKDDTALF